MSWTYPSFAKSERKDALVPDPQEYDMSDPDKADHESHEDQADQVDLSSAKGRLDLFSQLVKKDADVQP